MVYRKFNADYLFTGSLMLDDPLTLITDQQGSVIELVDKKDAGDDIETYSGILCPGFVNCHCHLELSHMKGLIPPGTGLVSFLLTVMNSRNIPVDNILNAIEASEAYMYERGIVAVGDICNTDHTLTQKNKRRLYYHSFMEALGFNEQTAEARFQHSLSLYERFRAPFKTNGHTEIFRQPGAAGKSQTDENRLHSVSIAPHAPYSVSAALFKRICGFTGNGLLTMHNQESDAENEFFLKGTGGMTTLYAAMGLSISDFQAPGKSSIQSVLPWFTGQAPLILVHNVVTDKEDMQWITENRQAPVYWCLCPNANRYVTGRLPDIGLFKEYGCRMVIGTDSLASNHQLDILEELKTLQQHFPELSTEELLSWATLNGAEALGIDKEFGSFEAGKKPGIVIIEGAGLKEGKARRLL